MDGWGSFGEGAGEKRGIYWGLERRRQKGHSPEGVEGEEGNPGKRRRPLGKRKKEGPLGDLGESSPASVLLLPHWVPTDESTQTEQGKNQMHIY